MYNQQNDKPCIHLCNILVSIWPTSDINRHTPITCVITVSRQICPTCAAYIPPVPPFAMQKYNYGVALENLSKSQCRRTNSRPDLDDWVSASSTKCKPTAIVQKSPDGLFVLASLRNCSQGDETLPNLTARPPGGHTWNYTTLRGADSCTKSIMLLLRCTDSQRRFGCCWDDGNGRHLVCQWRSPR